MKRSNSGFVFSEVAGTSAGSIVAALLAAGADPAFLLAKLEKLDFPSLLVKPTRSTFSTGSKLVSVFQIVPFKSEGLNSIVGIARLGGLHSSVGIKTWVETCLKELTGKQNDLCFSVIWSYPFTLLRRPEHYEVESLEYSNYGKSERCHAVRASCTIPLFFQPVEEGSALLVDGGIVSNIPHFLFAGASAQNTKSKNASCFSCWKRVKNGSVPMTPRSSYHSSLHWPSTGAPMFNSLHSRHRTHRDTNGEYSRDGL